MIGDAETALQDIGWVHDLQFFIHIAQLIPFVCNILFYRELQFCEERRDQYVFAGEHRASAIAHHCTTIRQTLLITLQNLVS